MLLHIKRKTRPDIIVNSQADLEDVLKRYINNFKRVNDHVLQLFKGVVFNSSSDFRKYLKDNIPNTKKDRFLYLGYNADEIDEYNTRDRDRARQGIISKRNKYGAGAVSIWTRSYWINKGYTEDEAKNKVAELQSENNKKVKNRSNTPALIEYWINKGYTEEDAINKRTTHQRIASPRCKEHWINKGYTEDEAKNKVAELQSNYSKLYIEKTDVHERRCNNRLCDEYWISKGFDVESIEKIKKENGHTFSLSKCIEIYGENEGRQRFDERQLKWLNSFRNKDQEEFAEIKLKQAKSGQVMHGDSLPPGILYIVEFDSKVKIGITTRTFSQRYNTVLEKQYEPEIINFNSIGDAFFVEQETLKHFRDNIWRENHHDVFGWSEIINNISPSVIKDVINEKNKFLRSKEAS